MNYIPGFSNHLETALPRYADGGAVAGDVALTPEQREARRIAANTLPQASSITGPYAGKDPLAFGADNTFRVGEGQEVRVVDAGGNVIFSGSGVDAANRAVAVAQSLSDDLGKNANFKIQTGERTINPDGSVGGTRYIDVARAAPLQTGLGFLADNVLPFAASFIPYVGPVLGAALGSAASSAAQGRGLEDALKRAAMAGGSAYLGGQVFGPASSSAGSNAGSVAGSTAGSVAGSVPIDDIINVIGPNLVGSTLGSTIGTGLSSVTGYKTPAEKFADQAPQQPVDYTPIGDQFGNEIISVTGNPAQGGLVSLADLGSITASLPALGGLASDPLLSQPREQPTTVEPDEEIVVNAPKAVTPDPVFPVGSVVAGLPMTGLPTADPALTGEGDKKLGVEDYLSIAGKVVPLLGAAAGGGGGSGQAGTYTSGGRGLNPIFSAKLPSAGGLGAIGATRTARPMDNVDWLTYGQRPELNFFDYSTQPTNPAPVTQPVPNNPAGPAMYVPDDMRFAEGGAFAAKGGGSSERTEFAVNGPGTGRSDDIPAVLSDGEYVIDAETVALLGDGSSKAGAKKLDDLRVKVRKHKGQKLAKGRFSANAKKPEAYLSGGRI
jgi:hypothetical protein